MKKLLLISALLGAATCAFAGCDMVNNTQKAEPDKKIVVTQADETADDTCPDCPASPECPDCPEDGKEAPAPQNDGDGENGGAPENPEPHHKKWIKNKFPRRRNGGDHRAPQPGKNFRRKG